MNLLFMTFERSFKSWISLRFPKSIFFAGTIANFSNLTLHWHI
jgi:hypothetical protein